MCLQRHAVSPRIVPEGGFSQAGALLLPHPTPGASAATPLDLHQVIEAKRGRREEGGRGGGWWVVARGGVRICPST